MHESPERKSIEQYVVEAGYDPDAIGEHDLGVLDRFREFLAAWKAMKSATGDERMALARKCIALGEAEPTNEG